MKVYNSKEIHKIVRKSGWIVKSTSGSHIKYIKDGISMIIPQNVNRMLIQRLSKQYGLGLF